MFYTSRSKLLDLVTITLSVLRDRSFAAINLTGIG